MQKPSFPWIVGCILLAIAAAVIAVKIFRVPSNTLVYGAFFLACPLMHIWMMRDGKHKH